MKIKLVENFSHNADEIKNHSATYEVLRTHEILREIFYRLDFSSLMQSFLVNKTWYALKKDQFLFQKILSSIPTVIGSREWNKHIAVLPYQSNVDYKLIYILDSPCPSNPVLKVKDTHTCLLIPHILFGEKQSLEGLIKIIANPLNGCSAGIKTFLPVIECFDNGTKKTSYLKEEVEISIFDPIQVESPISKSKEMDWLIIKNEPEIKTRESYESLSLSELVTFIFAKFILSSTNLPCFDKGGIICREKMRTKNHNGIESIYNLMISKCSNNPAEPKFNALLTLGVGYDSFFVKLKFK